jgi:phosphatidylserine/phosphatidylglycerophosphate/cardiolipin synthase-like enzyme
MKRNILIILIVFVAGVGSVHAKEKTLTRAIQSAFVSAPKDGDTCFSPDEPCDAKLEKFIEGAQKSIDIAIYDINLDSLAHQILILSKKIPIRLVIDKRQAKEKNSVVPMLIKAGLNLRYGHQRGIMHNKFTIVDGKMLETGSFNYTNHASRSNNENQIYLSTPAIVARYQARFDQIWNEAKPAVNSLAVSGE